VPLLLTLLQAAFSYENVLRSFDVLTFWLSNFLAKVARKMMVKLTAGGRVVKIDSSLELNNHVKLVQFCETLCRI